MIRQPRRRKRKYERASKKAKTDSTADVPDNVSTASTEEEPLSNTNTFLLPVPEKLTSTTKAKVTSQIDLNVERRSAFTSIRPSTSDVNSFNQPAHRSPTRSSPGSTPKRSMSPARFFIAREQSELQNLNDRLSSHLDTVKTLQAENSSLKLQMQGMEVLNLQEPAIKPLHNSNVDALQEQLVAAQQENCRLDETLQCARKERDSLRESLTEKEEDMGLMQLQIRTRKSMSQQYEKQQAELKTLQETLREKEEDASRLSEELVKEKMTKQRMKEELEFNKNRYIKQIQETSIRMNKHLETTDQKLEAGYEKLVSDALSSVREQNVRELADLKEEFAGIYQTKLNEWKTKAERSNADLLSSKKELKASKLEADNLHTRMTRLKMDFAGVKVQVEEEQTKNRKLKNDSEKEICQLQRETALLKQELAEAKEELEDLGGANVRLEQEITTYRVLIEDFETKNSITDQVKTLLKQGNERSKSAERESKGKDTETLPTNHYLRTNQVDYGVRIESVDRDGRYMTIINGTDHRVDMCLWMVRQSSLNKRVAYEIPCNTPLMSEQRLVIWSQGEGPFGNKPNSDEILSLSDDVDTRRFYRITAGVDDDQSNLTERPAMDAIHINMSGKRWMSKLDSMNLRLEDGDGQLQSKSDLTLNQPGVNDSPRTHQEPQSLRDSINPIKTKKTAGVKSKSCSRKRVKRRGKRSQSAIAVKRLREEENSDDDGVDCDNRESDSSPNVSYNGRSRKRERLQIMQADENGKLSKDGCLVM